MIRQDIQAGGNFTVVLVREDGHFYIRLLELQNGKKVFVTPRVQITDDQIKSLTATFSSAHIVIGDYELHIRDELLIVKVPVWDEVRYGKVPFIRTLNEFLSQCGIREKR